MWKVIFTSFFVLMFGFLAGQDFGGNNSVWIYDFTGGYTPGVTEVSYSRDTIIDNRIIKILEKKAFRSTNEDVDTFPRSPLYIDDQDGVVMYSQDLIHFDTLYNFQSDVGDSWRILDRNFNGELTGDFLRPIVVDKFSLVINGVNTKCLGVTYNPSNIVVDTICEGIGSRLFYILPFDFKAVAADGGEGGLLRCFSNDVLGVVPHEYPFSIYGNGFSFSDFEFDCNQLSTSTSTIPTSNEEISIFPNPASSNIHIQSEREEIKSISIYNLQGLSILEKQGFSNSMDVDIRLLPSGMYFVLINEKYFEKVIVER